MRSPEREAANRLVKSVRAHPERQYAVYRFADRYMIWDAASDRVREYLVEPSKYRYLVGIYDHRTVESDVIADIEAMEG